MRLWAANVHRQVLRPCASARCGVTAPFDATESDDLLHRPRDASAEAAGRLMRHQPRKPGRHMA